jgi:hypothetical protein
MIKFCLVIIMMIFLVLCSSCSIIGKNRCVKPDLILDNNLVGIKFGVEF